MIGALRKAGFVPLEQLPFDDFSHWVEQAVNRDMVVAQKTNMDDHFSMTFCKKWFAYQGCKTEKEKPNTKQPLIMFHCLDNKFTMTNTQGGISCLQVNYMP